MSLQNNDKEKNIVLKSQSNNETKPMFSPEESFKIYDGINSKMRDLRRDFQKKAQKSHMEASNIILTS